MDNDDVKEDNNNDDMETEKWYVNNSDVNNEPNDQVKDIYNKEIVTVNEKTKYHMLE